MPVVLLLLVFHLVGQVLAAKGPQYAIHSFEDDGKLQYCAGNNFEELGICQVRGPTPLFPKGSALDWALRSRLLPPPDHKNLTYSTDPLIPGMLADAMMEMTLRNYYVTSINEVTASVQVDHILCADEDCSSFVDLYWGNNGSGTLQPLIRYGGLPGNDYIGFPSTCIPGAEVSINCTDDASMGTKDMRVSRCSYSNWEDPLNEDFQMQQDKWAQPVTLFNQVAQLSRIFADDVFVPDARENPNENVTMSIGTFTEPDLGCIRLIVPLSDALRNLNWGRHDDCENATGLYLFNTYYMDAYAAMSSDDSPTTATRDRNIWKENVTAGIVWEDMNETEKGDTVSNHWYTQSVGYECTFPEAQVLVTGRMAECRTKNYEAAGIYPYVKYGDFPTYTFCLLAISGRPIWALSLTGKNLDMQLSFSSNYTFTQELVRSAESSLGEAWCLEDSNARRKFILADDNKTVASVCNCSVTKRMNLFNLTTGAEKPPLKKLVDALEPRTPRKLGQIYPLTDEGYKADQVLDYLVEAAINNTLAGIAADIQANLLLMLAGTDETATVFGSITNLLVTLLTSFITYLGVGDVYEACANITDKLKLGPALPATVVFLAMAALLIIPPTAFYIQEDSTMQQNPHGTDASIRWYKIKLRDNYLASAVSTTYKSTETRVGKPLAIAAIVVACLAVMLSLTKLLSYHRRRAANSSLGVLGKTALAAGRFKRLRHGKKGFSSLGRGDEPLAESKQDTELGQVHGSPRRTEDLPLQQAWPPASEMSLRNWSSH